MASICLGLEEGDSEYDYRSDAFRPEIGPKRNGYLPPVEVTEEAIKRDALNRRIQLVAQNHKTTTYDIDQSIRATVPSDGFRDTRVKHWEAEQSSYKRCAWTAVVLTVGGIATLLSSVPYIALASIVTAVYAAVQFHKANLASNQVEGWKVDPAVKLALERKKAYEEGFSYVYNNNLKLNGASHFAVLLPREVEYLYNRYFDRTCVELSAQRCVSDQQKKSWLDRFLVNNPISRNVLLYVFERIPDEFSSQSRNFESIAASLRNIETEFSNLRARQQAEANQIMKEIESQRTIALAIPSAALRYKLNEAESERDQRLLDAFGAQQRSQIQRDYEANREKYYALYAVAVLPINSYFDGKVKEARNALRDVLGAISRQEANAFSPYYEYSQGIVLATAAAKNPDYVYTQQQFNPTQYFQVPPLPKIEINFIYQPPTGVDDSFWQH